MNPHLVLYHFPRCPSCLDVRREAHRLNVQLELRNVRQGYEDRTELLAATKRETVPVLRIESEDGKVEWRPNSQQIIAYLVTLRPDADPPTVWHRHGLRRGPWLLLCVAAFAPRAVSPYLCAVVGVLISLRYRAPPSSTEQSTVGGQAV